MYMYVRNDENIPLKKTMSWCNVFAILCVCTLKNTLAHRNIISYGIAKLNLRQVGSVTTVLNVSLEKCLEACTSRQNCKGINYSKKHMFCEVVSYDNAALSSYEQKLSYISIDRNELEEESVTQGKCNSCTNGVCDPTTDTCQVKECSPVQNFNGYVFGNIRTIGSKVKVTCAGNLLLTTGVSALVCTPGGVWSSNPSCAWDCGEPYNGWRNAYINAGDTYNGSIRTYTCKEGFFISRRRNETQLNVTCHNGGLWLPSPRCVVDCEEPINASDVYAIQRDHSGQWFQDLDLVNYTCMPNHVIFITMSGTLKGVSHFGGYFFGGRPGRSIRCDGTLPKWIHNDFTCVKYCSDKPSKTNLKSIKYNLTGDNVSAIYSCKKGYTVFDGSDFLGTHQFTTACDVETDGIWTNHTLSCQKDCSMLPNTANVQKLTYTSENDNLTIATFVCQDGYTVYDDSSKLDIEIFDAECNTPDGTWTNNTRSCHKDCNNSPLTTNVQNITYTHDDNVTTGTFTCKDGYTVYGHSTRLALDMFNTECNVAYGTWTNNTWSCERDCNNSPLTTNVQNITYTHDDNVTTGTFMCKDGYTVYGDSTRLALDMFNTECSVANGVWTNNTWRCERDCSNSPPTTNVQTVIYTFDETVTTGTFVCKDGYSVYDGSTNLALRMFNTACSENNGNWTNNTWSCTRENNCNNIPLTTNVQTLIYTYDETVNTVTYVCMDGFSVYDDSTRLALAMFDTNCNEANGTWTNNTWSCQKDCNNSPPTTNVKMMAYTYDAACTTGTFACRYGYAVYDNSTRLAIRMFNTVCSEANGTWTNNTRSCQKECFSGPNTTNAQSVTYAVTDDNVTAIATCSEGHTVFNASIRLNLTMFVTVCKEPGGAWTNDSLSCRLETSLGAGSTSGSGSTTGDAGSSDSTSKEDSR